ncbi:uncharacterized protein LOC103712805 isoform X1 [Phoenix dactylifera]|uniref:Uncharacterized protein LOC103712805 isoform X1 n=2 Tax=Phoenix dactylifera TaxID=42345 RepID=A0A8B7CEY5_PHODC|nr:uncharacterized protein LOC103712805 isoform X1 [Phoenix dactylifera]
MVLASKLDGGTQTISFRVRKTIQSIKEIVGNHSDADIYAVLRETGMDPNETAQKLLNQDTFHEVKRKRDRKKESTGYRASVDTRIRTVHKIQREKSQASWGQNAKRGGYPRSPVPGPNREFRIVRDNRMNQRGSEDVKPESLHNSSSSNEHMISNVSGKGSPGILTDQKQLAVRNSEEQTVIQGLNGRCDSGPGHAKDVKSTSNHSTASNLTTVGQRRVENDSQVLSPTLASTNSVIGMSFSSSDPVHVPSPDSRSAGTVGAIRREVGVVGVRRQSSDRPAIKSSFSSSSASVALLKDNASSTAISGSSVTTSKSNQFTQSSSLEPIMPSMSISRSISSGQSIGKLHHLPAGHQKATQPSMEWKPKPSPKLGTVSPGVNETTPPPSCANISSGSNQEELAGLSEKLSQVDFFGDEHVIIPEHLRVPETEWTQLIFGSFGAGFDSTKGLPSALQAQGNAEELSDGPSASLSAAVPAGSSEDASAAKTDPVDSQLGTSRSHSPATAGEEKLVPGKKDILNPQNIDSYADIGLVQSNSPSYSASEPQLQNNPSLPSFTAYDPQTRYDLPFFRTAIEDTEQGQDIASATEVHSSHPTNSTQMSMVTTVQQQQPIQQQQQQVAQLYPQVHISHFPNFMPYRHVFSPVYVPPMAMPNYSSNAAYPHPPNGSNYLVMPGGNSHITASGMKYATSQYKPVPAGSPNAYGSYTNPSGFTMSAPGTVGSTSGLDEASRIKYKDNSSYVPNPQAETSDIWIQTPRDLPNLQSAPFYNLSGQAAAPHAAYLPTHAGHASFNAAAQTSHVQYPGMYHSPQPASMASIASPHPLVHQQMQPGLGGNVGVGVAAPGAQVGTYQQPQLGHLGWTANF